MRCLKEASRKEVMLLGLPSYSSVDKPRRWGGRNVKLVSTFLACLPAVGVSLLA